MPRLIVALLILLTTAFPALAGGGLSVSPLLVEFGPDGGARTVEVANPGDEPVNVQVRLFDWRVDQDGEHYEASQDVAFSPPMFVLPPGGSQLVRLAPRRPTAGAERAWRLFVDQVPEQAAPGQLQMPVRMVLPVFAPQERLSSQPPLRWRLEHDRASGEAVLVAGNGGRRRAKVTELAYAHDGRKVVLRPGLAGYVLAGQELGWRFPAPARLTPIDITANTDAGPVQVRVHFPAD